MMNTRVSLFFDRLKGKKIAVVGAGVSHIDLIRLFAQKKLDVTLHEKRSAEELGELYDEFAGLGVKFSLGGTHLDDICKADIIFRSPGMYYNMPQLQHARLMGVAVTSELEVFFDLCPCRIIAVTGSDGKTTTTTLIAKFLEAQGEKVHLGGNIGRALLPIIEEVSAEDYAVIELSSFQLISMRNSPDIAVITNISPNHLDVHKDMQDYIDAKKNIVLHQNGCSKTVLNSDNEDTMALIPNIRGKLELFSRRHSVHAGGYLGDDGIIYHSDRDGVVPVMRADEIKLPGLHNVENFLTAVTATWGLVSPENMKKVGVEFGGVEHRIEFVRELEGVKYYNDSIASSPTRTIAGLHAFGRKIIAIMGGYDKNIPYQPLAPEVLKGVKVLVLMGATADKIEKAVTEHADYPDSGIVILHASTMEEAVDTARNSALDGDIITLSPASASFDLYKNFEERGRHYKSIVNALS